MVPGVAIAGLQRYEDTHPTKAYQWEKHRTFEISLAQSGDCIADGLAAGPHLLQTLLWGRRGWALCKRDFIPGFLLGLGTQKLLAGLHIVARV